MTDRTDHSTQIDSTSLHEAPSPLHGRRLVLGVCGSIAAIKTPLIASSLVQKGVELDIVMTASACKLVQPLAFRAITHREVTSSLWDSGSRISMDHIEFAHAAEAILIAPATADVIARLAIGRASDALTTTCLATRAPIFIAPAMEPNMWSHPATQEHVATLESRGVRFIGPDEGRMASGLKGKGRLREPESIVDQLEFEFSRLQAPGGTPSPLAGKKVLITAGPTHEALDPVRYLGNRSTGTMGFALARRARDLGADVTLVAGPVRLETPYGVQRIDCRTALAMNDQVLQIAPSADLVVMCAAVADYRPAKVSDKKIKKSDGPISLELTRNPDILKSIDAKLQEMPAGTPVPLRIGFAAESNDLVSNARQKLNRKALDLVVANEVPASFGAGTHRACFVEEESEHWFQADSKKAMSDAILYWAAKRLA